MARHVRPLMQEQRQQLHVQVIVAGEAGRRGVKGWKAWVHTLNKARMASHVDQVPCRFISSSLCSWKKYLFRSGRFGLVDRAQGKHKPYKNKKKKK